jgi:Dyp-type peroxidase family
VKIHNFNRNISVIIRLDLCACLKYSSSQSYYVICRRGGYISKAARDIIEERYKIEKRKQPGVAFPSATNQAHILIIRFNISDKISGINDKDREIIREGLNSLCGLFDDISKGERKIERLTDDGDMKMMKLSEFNFSATVGFGAGFFRKLNIPMKNRPRKLRDMPNYSELADGTPYSLIQTDFIIQLGANEDYVNRWVFQNQVGVKSWREERISLPYAMRQPRRLKSKDTDNRHTPDLYTAMKSWANITDIHSGFQRIDGKNLLGFNDGISNPFRLSNDVIWTTVQDEGEKFQDGTYMVFQKIEHDLEKWQAMHEEKQELWVGRSKGTGLLLGTLSKDEDEKLALEMRSNEENVRMRAMTRWKNLYNQQKFPDTRFYDPAHTQFRGIQLECPVWSHVRKANPRQADGAARILIFRRGYLFNEDGPNGKSSSGLLFICFQRDVERGFEYIKKKFLNNENFPVPERRKNFNSKELQKRHQQGRFTIAEQQKLLNIGKSCKVAIEDDTQNTGRDGLSGPSENGVYPQGQFPITTTLGGGYYFIPPIPSKNISNLAEQFFD